MRSSIVVMLQRHGVPIPEGITTEDMLTLVERHVPADHDWLPHVHVVSFPSLYVRGVPLKDGSVRRDFSTGGDDWYLSKSFTSE